MGEFRSLLLLYGVYCALAVLFMVLAARSTSHPMRSPLLILLGAGLFWVVGDAIIDALLRRRLLDASLPTLLCLRLVPALPFVGATLLLHGRLPRTGLRSRLARSRYRALALPSLAMGVIATAVLFATGARDFVFLGVLCGVVPVTVIAYMITMYRFWNHARILSRIALYYGISLAAAAAFFFFLRAGDSAGHETPPFYLYSAFLLLSAVITAVAFLHNHYLRVTLQFAFFRDVYRKEKALSRFINEMPAGRGESEEILENLLEIMLQNLYEVFRFDRGFIITADRNRKSGRKYFGPPADAKQNDTVDKLPALLRRRLPEGVPAEIDRVFPLEADYEVAFTDESRRIVSALRDKLLAFRELGYAVFMPLVLRDEIWGVVVLGDKANGRPYFSGEFKLLENARPAFALALRNNALVEELREPEPGPGMSVPDPTREPPEVTTIRMKDRRLIFAGEPMRGLVEKTGRIAASSLPVLIRGETGTGKELIARLLHKEGPGPDAPFVPVNCAAIPASLWEAEIFGHQKGAFTGAVATRPGLVEQARGGILFLDEIGEMPLEMQPKILRLIQEKTYQSVGGRRMQQADCRLVFATHRDLNEMIKEGSFREDLYYRINVHTLHIPPLRERFHDIPFIIEQLLEAQAADMQLPATELPRETLELLTRYHWPGNIRELENCLVRLLTESGGQAPGPENLPAEIRANKNTPSAAKRKRAAANPSHDYEKLMEGYEREVLTRALQSCEGNRTHAARMLNISRGKLIYRIRELGIRD